MRHPCAGGEFMDRCVVGTGAEADHPRAALADMLYTVAKELPGDALPAVIRIHAHPFEPDLARRLEGDLAEGHDLLPQFTDDEATLPVGQPQVPNLGDVIAVVPGMGTDAFHSWAVPRLRRADGQFAVHSLPRALERDLVAKMHWPQGTTRGLVRANTAADQVVPDSMFEDDGQNVRRLAGQGLSIGVAHDLEAIVSGPHRKLGLARTLFAGDNLQGGLVVDLLNNDAVNRCTTGISHGKVHIVEARWSPATVRKSIDLFDPEIHLGLGCG